MARRRARLRADQRALATEALMQRVRGMNASVTSEQRARNDQAFANLAEDAAQLLRQIRSDDDA